MGPNSDPAPDADTPAVAYSPLADRYLVVWRDDDYRGLSIDDDYEIFGRLISGATGAITGPDDPLISSAGGLGDPAFGAFMPDVAYNSVDDRFLVVWKGEDDIAPLGEGEFEIFGQRMSSLAIFIDGIEAGDTDNWSATSP